MGIYKGASLAKLCRTLSSPFPHGHILRFPVRGHRAGTIWHYHRPSPCSDTQKPARFAVVYLVNAPPAGKSPFDNPGQISKRGNGDWVTHALLDGSFVLRNLPAGSYDLKIEYPGYIDPAPFSLVLDLMNRHCHP